jgi:hypothetical protein
MKLLHQALHPVPLELRKMWRFEKREEPIAPVLNHREVWSTLENRGSHDAANVQNIMLDNRVHMLSWTFALSTFSRACKPVRHYLFVLPDAILSGFGYSRRAQSRILAAESSGDVGSAKL